VLSLAMTVSAQKWKGPRVPRLTRHSGVIRLHSWGKGFVSDKWIGPGKSALVGAGDWIQLAGSWAQADIVFPDLTTVLMRKGGEIQILRVGSKGEMGGKGHEIAILGGVYLDFTLTEIPMTLRFPGDRELRWRGGTAPDTKRLIQADLMIRFEPYNDRVRIRHLRGLPVEVVKRGRVVRMLEPRQEVHFRWEDELEGPTTGPHDPSRRFVFFVSGRRVEIPPGVIYAVEGQTIFFRRDPVLGSTFGTIRIDDDVVVVGPGSAVEVRLRPRE